MLGASYKTKKVAKESIGQPPRFIETSMYGPEYTGDGTYTVVGPDPYTNRRWYGQITVTGGVVTGVK